MGAINPCQQSLNDRQSLYSVRQEVRNLTGMSMQPDQPPDQPPVIKDLERSARAELKLRLVALKHANGEQIRARLHPERA